MRFLLFQLYGPLASWGEIAPGDERATNLHPTRSALLGLLAAALGLERRDEEAHGDLAADLRFALRVHSAGVPGVDFHTAQLRPPRARWKPRSRREQLAAPRHQLATVTSRRDYRCDAFAEVAVWSEAVAPRFSLDRIAHALEHPRFCLYLGRKACPAAMPLAPAVVDAATLVAAFGRSRNAAGEGLLPLHRLSGRAVGGEVGLFWDESQVVDAGLEAQQAFERRDDPVSRSRRTFRTRWEHFAPVEEKEPDDGSEPTEAGS